MSDYQPITADTQRPAYMYVPTEVGTVALRALLSDSQLRSLEPPRGTFTLIHTLANQHTFVQLARAQQGLPPGQLLPDVLDLPTRGNPGQDGAAPVTLEGEGLDAHLRAAEGTLAFWRERWAAEARIVESRLPDSLDVSTLRAALDPPPRSQSEHALAPAGSVGFVRVLGEPVHFAGLRPSRSTRGGGHTPPVNSLDDSLPPGVQIFEFNNLDEARRFLATGELPEGAPSSLSDEPDDHSDPGNPADFRFPEP